MPDIRSLHVGLNALDADAYDGFAGQLFGCENDAVDMSVAVKAAGAKSQTVLLTKQAKASIVLSELRAMMYASRPGDLVIFTNSSHGSQVADRNGDEADKMDETICMYDRMIIDDELAAVYSLALAGVDILSISDSCHSGTMLRLFPGPGNICMASRELPHTVSLQTVATNEETYGPILEDKALKEYRGQVKASVLHIGACSDSQTAYDGVPDAHTNGLFTENLLKVMKQYKPKSYGMLVAYILRQMPADQVPQFRYTGPLSRSFIDSAPFSRPA